MNMAMSGLNAFVSHQKAPLFAAFVFFFSCVTFYRGSSEQFMRVYNSNGDALGTMRYHEGFLGQRMAGVVCLAFHP